MMVERKKAFKQTNQKMNDIESIRATVNRVRVKGRIRKGWSVFFLLRKIFSNKTYQ